MSLKEEELQIQACSLFLQRGKRVINILFQSELLTKVLSSQLEGFPLCQLHFAISVRQVLSLASAKCGSMR